MFCDFCVLQKARGKLQCEAFISRRQMRCDMSYRCIAASLHRCLSHDDMLLHII